MSRRLPPRRFRHALHAGLPAQRRAPDPIPPGPGPLTFPPGTPSHTVTLSPDTRDSLDEDGETFTPAPSSPSDATPGSPWSASAGTTP